MSKQSTVVKTPKVIELANKAVGDGTKQLDALSNEVKGLVINNPDGEAHAADIIKKLRTIRDQAEAVRRELVDPLNELVKTINTLFKNVTGRVDAGEKLLKDNIAAWREREKQRIAEEQRKAEEEYQKKLKAAEKKAKKSGKPVANVPPPPVEVETQRNSVQGHTAASIGRKVWTYDVVDEKLVPREYLVVDTKAITAAIRSGIRDIAGVKIYEKEEIVVK